MAAAGGYPPLAFFFGVALAVLFPEGAFGQAGTILWQANVGSRFEGGATLGGNGLVYVGTELGKVHALDAATGATRWVFTPGSRIDGAPAVDDRGVVYVAGWDFKVHALRGDTGAKLWEYGVPFLVLQGLALGPAGELFVATGNGRVLRLDRTTGRRVWEVDLKVSTDRASLTIGPDGAVFVGTKEAGLVALSGATGARQWTSLSGETLHGPPAIGIDGTVFCGTASGAFHALDGATGSLLWRFDAGVNIESAPAMDRDGTVYFGSDNQRVYALRGDTGEKRWEYHAGDWVRSGVLGRDGRFYLGTANGFLALNRTNGSLAWAYGRGKSFLSSANMGPDGVIYAGTTDGTLHAIRSDSLGGLEPSIWPRARQNARSTGRWGEMPFAPGITRQPAAWTPAVLGRPFVLEVGAAGSAPLAYQWFRDGVAVPGGTEPALRIASATASESGVYTVRVSNDQGEVTSREGTVQLFSYLPPLVTLLEPAPGADSVAPDVLVRATLRNGDTSVDRGSLRLRFAGQDVTAQAAVTQTQSEWEVSFRPGLLERNRRYLVELTWGDDRTPPLLQTNAWSFSTLNVPVVSASRRFLGATPGDPGFRLRVAQTAVGRGISDSVAAGEALLSSNPSPPIAHRATNVVPVLNLGKLNSSYAGTFRQINGYPDFIWSQLGLDQTGGPFAIECLGLIELPAGRVRLGIISDDGFRFSLQPTPDASGVLVLDQSPDSADGERQFEFFVERQGLYPFRLMYWEWGETSFLEFFSVNPATRVRTLVNDTQTSGALRAFLMPPPVVLTSPRDGERFAAPATLPIVAVVPDATPMVTRVEFYEGSTKLGEDGSAPYEWTWSGVGAGTYTVTARAVDDRGASMTSAAVTVRVEEPPTVEVLDAVVTEGAGAGGGLAFGVRLTKAGLEPVRVGYATRNGTAVAGSDYQGASGELVFAVGETEKTVVVGVVGDEEVEPDETLELVLGPVSGAGVGRGVATGTIRNDDVANQPPTVVLSGPSEGAKASAPASWGLRAMASDADGMVERVEFYVGSTKLGEDGSAPYEWAWSGVRAGTYTLTARAVDDRGASMTSAAVTVRVEEPPTVEVLDAVVTEGAGAGGGLAFGVRLTKAGLEPVRVGYATRNGTAVAGSDYQGASGELVFAVGETEKTVVVGVVGDEEVEPDETLELVLGPVSGAGVGRGVATGTIRNDDVANQPPTVALARPPAWHAVAWGAPIALSAIASDPDGSVREVVFYVGTERLGEDRSPPFEFEWRGAPAGFHSVSARATDNQGLVSWSTPVRIEVTPFRASVAILGLPEQPEVQRYQEYLFAMNRGTRVFRPGLASPGDLLAFEMVIWCQAGRVPVTEDEVRMLAGLKESGIPLYFIGERLAAEAADLGSLVRRQWQDLVGLESRSGLVGEERLEMLDAHVALFGNIAPVIEYSPARLGFEAAQGIGGRLPLARSGQRDVVVAYVGAAESGSSLEYRSVAQNLYVASEGPDAGVALRAVLFQSAACWLLRCDRCAAFNLLFLDGARRFSGPVGDVIDVPLTLGQRYRCVSTGVRLEAELPPGVEWLGGTASVGRSYEQDGRVTFVVGHFAAADELEVSLRVRAWVPARHEILFKARANESPEGGFDSQTSVVVETSGSSPRPVLEVLRTDAGWELRWPAWAEGWTLEASLDPSRPQGWQALPVVTTRSGTFLRTSLLPGVPAARFFRLRQ